MSYPSVAIAERIILTHFPNSRRALSTVIV